MKLPRDLSGRQLVRSLEREFGYRVVHQRGSHIVLETGTPGPHRVVVPDHRPLRIGTLNSILRAVARAQGLTKEQAAARLL